jgi:hypothetical protein
MIKKRFEGLLAGVRQMDRHMRSNSVPGVRVTTVDSIQCRKTPLASEQTQETLALLKILDLGNEQIAAGKTRPLSRVLKSIRGRGIPMRRTRPRKG